MTLRWVAAEMRGTLSQGCAVIDDLPSLDVDGPLRNSLSNYDTASAKLQLDGASDTWERAVKECASWLACYDDEAIPGDPHGPIEWCGYVSSAPPEAASNEVSLSLVTAGGYLDRVFVPDRLYEAATWRRNTIVSDLVTGLISSNMGGRKGVPLRLNPVGGTGPKPRADYVWQNTDNTTVLGRMTSLFGELGGEWFIDWDWSDDRQFLIPTLSFGDRIGDPPVAGLGSKATFEFPGSLLNFKETRDYSEGKGANHITGYSTPAEGETVVPFADPVLVNDPDRPTFEFRYQPAPGLSAAQCRTYAQLASQVLGPGSRSYELPASREALDTRRYGVDYGMGDDIDARVAAADRDGRPILAFPGGKQITGRVIAYEIDPTANTAMPILAEPTFVQTDNENQVLT